MKKSITKSDFQYKILQSLSGLKVDNNKNIILKYEEYTYDVVVKDRRISGLSELFKNAGLREGDDIQLEYYDDKSIIVMKRLTSTDIDKKESIVKAEKSSETVPKQDSITICENITNDDEKIKSIEEIVNKYQLFCIRH